MDLSNAEILEKIINIPSSSVYGKKLKKKSIILIGIGTLILVDLLNEQ